MAETGPSPPAHREFSIGAVLSLAATGYIDHFWLVTVCYLLGSLFANMLLLQGLLSATEGLWITNVIGLLFAAPAVVTLSRDYRGENPGLWANLRWVLRRSAILLVSVVLATAVTLPVFALAPRANLITASGLAYFFGVSPSEILCLSFNGLFLVTVIVEPSWPWSAAVRAFKLLSTRWMQMLLLAALVWGVNTLLVISLLHLEPHLATNASVMTFSCLTFALRMLVFMTTATAAQHLLRSDVDGLSPRQAADVFD